MVYSPIWLAPGGAHELGVGMWPNCTLTQVEAIRDDAISIIREFLNNLNSSGRGTAVFSIVGPNLPRRLSSLQITLLCIDLSSALFPQCDQVRVMSKKDSTGVRWLSIVIVVTRNTKGLWFMV